MTFLADGEVFATNWKLTSSADETVVDALRAVRFDVETHERYGPGDGRTVFVATAQSPGE